MGFRGLESMKRGRSAYLLQRSRHAVSDGFPVFRHPPCVTCASRPLSRGHHGPDVSLLSEPRAPLQGVLPETSRRPALPHPPRKRRAAPDFPTRSRVVTSPRGGATHGEGRRPSWASTSLQRLRNRESASRGRCAPTTVRPQRFARSRRFSPLETCPGLFHPGNAPGIRPSGCSPPAGQILSQGPFLSCRFRPTCAREGDASRIGFRGLLPPGIRSVGKR
jgi:hypothetical protein